MNELVERVEQAIFDRRLLAPRQSVLVAVSGGLDSMVLLRVLAGLASKHRWRLRVAHFNHLLRGRSSQADERCVRRAAEQLKLPITVERADVRRFARTHRLSLEMAARRLRHEFYARTARGLKMPVVALGHHADDQVELFFLRLLRGAGPEGLAGMRWASPSPADPAITLVRPLLRCTKAELLEFAVREKIPFREDVTNRRLDILRNRVRHELLPLLTKNYQSALNQTILRTMELLGAEASMVSEAAAAWLGKKRRVPFARLPPAVQRRCVQQQLFGLGVAGDYELIEQLRVSQKPVTARPGLILYRDAAGLVRRQVRCESAFDRRARAVRLAEPGGTLHFGPVEIEWAVEAGGEFNFQQRVAGTEYFDADRVGRSIRLRHWQPGDRFQPIGMRKAAKLQDLFTNLKIPRALRHGLVVAATAAGELFWVEGLRISDQFKITGQTRRRLRWRWRREPL